MVILWHWTSIFKLNLKFLNILLILYWPVQFSGSFSLMPFIFHTICPLSRDPRRQLLLYLGIVVSLSTVILTLHNTSVKKLYNFCLRLTEDYDLAQLYNGQSKRLIWSGKLRTCHDHGNFHDMKNDVMWRRMTWWI